MKRPVPLLLACTALVGLAPMLALPARADDLGPLKAALAPEQRLDLAEWSYRIDTVSEDLRGEDPEQSRVELVDASRPPAQRRILLSVDGAEPSAEARSRYCESRRDAVAANRGQRPDFREAMVGALGDATLISRTGTEARYRLDRLPPEVMTAMAGDNEMLAKMADKITMELVIAIPAGAPPRIETVILRNTGKIKPAAVARIDALLMEVGFQPDGATGKSIQTTMVNEIEGQAMLGTVKFHTRTRVVRSQFTPPGQPLPFQVPEAAVCSPTES